MTALTLPFPTVTAAEVAVRSGWAMVDGVALPGRTSTVIVEGKSAVRTTLLDHFGPPPEWVRAAGDCETCRGTGMIDARTNGPEYLTLKRCPTCHGVGKPRVEVTAPCPSEPWHDGWHNCALCSSTSIIHVAWVTVTEVLPVLGHHEPQTSRVVVNAEGQVIVYRMTGPAQSTFEDITADVAHLGPPAELIGKFLVSIQAVQK